MSLRTTSTVRSLCIPPSSFPLTISPAPSLRDCDGESSFSTAILPATFVTSSSNGVGDLSRPRLGSRTNSKT